MKGVGKRRRQLVSALAGISLCACASEAPPPTPHSADLRVSEEVFRLFCMRVARAAHPTDPDGIGYDALCEGAPQQAPDASAQFNALLARRSEIVAALDQVFGEDDLVAVAGLGLFEEDALRNFLASLIPFYDDGTMPRSTRALADVMGTLLDENDARSRQVIDTLARLSPRRGYRATGDTIAAVRPMLDYPRLDQFSQQLLGFVAEGGPAHAPFVELLRAATLELAEPAAKVSDAEADKTTLHYAAKLLLTENDAFADASDPAKYYVRRDNQGNALSMTAGNAGASPAPFAVYGEDDSAPARDAKGRALSGSGGGLLYRFGDANRTLLAGLLRDQKPLLERNAARDPSAVEKLLHGVRAILGPDIQRSEKFTTRLADTSTNQPATTGTLSFTGPDVEHSPLLDLVHSITQLLRYPETDRLLAVLAELLDKHESAAAGPVYAGLAVDRRADAHPEAQLTGIDGKPGGPQEFWDDVIDIGMRMAARPGLFHDAILALSTPEGAATGRLVAQFMKYSDEVTYEGAPITLGSDGRYSDADAKKMNTPVAHTWSREVKRGAGLDVGMNRSLFQRLLSTIHASNGAANCNKENATLSVKDPTTGTQLTFPDPTARPAQCNGDLVCDTLAATAYTAIDTLCAYKGSAPQGFSKCGFVRQPNGAVSHIRAIIGKSDVVLKDEQLGCLNDAGLAGDLAATQESSTQIDGFRLSLTPESIARFIYAPRNKFVTDLFDPFPTVHGVTMNQFEPNYLFALEVKDPNVLAQGQPMSFLTSSKDLIAAFDGHETFSDSEDGPISDGYLFADLMAMLHTHWPSKRSGDCSPSVEDARCKELGLTGAQCRAGCSQSLRPGEPFYAKQSNLVSYEALLIEAFGDERLSEVLAASVPVLQGIQITGEDGVQRDGVTVLADFLEVALKPDPALSSYGAKRKYAKTNTCVNEQLDPSTGQGVCGCPAGSTPADPSVKDGPCKLASGALVPRGRVLAQTTPLHLVLDALKRFDDAFADPAYQDRLTPWREARSALVDTFLTVNRSTDPTRPGAYVYKLQSQHGRRAAIEAIAWLRERIANYRAADAQGEALDKWALGLPDRLASVLGHPLLARTLDLMEKLWEQNGPRGPSDELVSLSAYMIDPANAERFAGLVLAAADTLELIDRDRSLTPAIQFAALVVADNAFTALDSLTGAPTPPQVEDGALLDGLELTRKVADLNKGSEMPSVLSRILRNAVLSDPNKGGRAPLETLLDAIADVNRADPSVSTSVPHSATDLRSVMGQVQSFMSDEDRGLERLYKVIGTRKLKPAQGQP